LLFLGQHGPTIFDLLAISHKRDDLWATSNKMMYNGTDHKI